MNQGSSIGESKGSLYKMTGNIGNEEEGCFRSGEFLHQKTSPYKTNMKLKLKESDTGSSMKKFNHILSLYDKTAAEKPSEIISSKIMVPKFGIKSQVEKSGPLMKKSSLGYNHSSYLTKVKEILTARKAAIKHYTGIEKKSPRSQKPLDLFSSLKEEDILRIHDMKSLEHSGTNLTVEVANKKQKTRASMVGTYGLNSPNNYTSTSVQENDDYSIHYNTRETIEFEPFTRQSLGSPPTTRDIGDPRLNLLIRRIKETLNERDAEIENLVYERNVYRSELEMVNKENEFLRSKLSQYEAI